MIRPTIVAGLMACLVVCNSTAIAQEKSVRPGINDNFRNPNPTEFVGRFEVESREVFQHRNKILEACKIEPGQTVADIGAGTGLFTRLFAEAVGKEGHVYSVDIAKRFLEYIDATSRKLGQKNVKTILCTADSTQLPENSIDVAFICDTYHHFEFPAKTMASLRRALKPGGRLILIDFHRIPGKTKEWTLNHVRAGKEIVESEVVESGFLKTRNIDGILEENYIVEFTKSNTSGLKVPQYPILAGYGGVVPVAGAVEKPRPGAKVLLDVTAATPADTVHKGLDRAARLINLYGAAGLKSSDLKLAIVLHGDATRAVLNDDFYRAKFGAKQNPSLPLIKKLQELGVEVFVCGQALNYKGIPESAVERGIPIAESAMSVLINRQMDGYAFLPVP